MSQVLASLFDQLDLFIRFAREHRKEWRYPFYCCEDLVRQRGRVYTRSLKPPPVRPLPRSCFSQAYRLSQRKNSPWIYCEGFAISANTIGMHVHHGWIAHRDRPLEAVDVAWHDGDPATTAYVGIPFQREFVRRMHIRSRRKFYSVLDAWWAHDPLLTGEIKIDEVTYD